MFKCVDVDSGVLLHSPFTGRKLKLTAKEKKVLLDTWHNVTDKDKACEAVFTAIFHKKPALKRLWQLDGVDDSELANHTKFIRHAVSFSKFLDVAVRSINLEGDYLVICARNVGVRHCYFKEVNFDAENWLLFKNTVLECLLPFGNGIATNLLTDTWNLFLAFIITGEHRSASFVSLYQKSCCLIDSKFSHYHSRNERCVLQGDTQEAYQSERHFRSSRRAKSTERARRQVSAM